MPSQVLRQESHMPPANPVGNDPRFDPYPWSGAPTTTLLPTQVEYHHQQPRHPNMRPVYEGTSRYPYDLDNNAMSSRMPERRASFSTRHLPTLLFTEQQSQPQEWRAPQQYDYVPEPSTSALYQGNSDHDSWEDERNLAYGVPHRTSNARTELPPIDTRYVCQRFLCAYPTTLTVTWFKDIWQITQIVLGNRSQYQTQTIFFRLFTILITNNTIHANSYIYMHGHCTMPVFSLLVALISCNLLSHSRHEFM